MELIIFRDSKEVGRLRLSEGTFSIGRGLQNTIALDEQDVSRRHARIHVEDGRVLVEDLGSANGTFLHGKPLKQKTELENGDILEIGPYFIQAILDDEFVSHTLERTESHATLKAIERSARRKQAQKPPDDRDQSRDTAQSVASGAGSDQPQTPPHPTPGQPGGGSSARGEDRGEWLSAHELFGLTEEGWQERNASPGTSASGASSSPAADQARAASPGDSSESGEEGILIPVDEVFPSGDEAAADAREEEDDIELEELVESEGGSASQGGEPLHYDDWRAQDPNETGHRLPNTPNLADHDPVEPESDPDRFPDQALEAPTLVVREGFAKQDAFILGEGAFYIGRAEEMDVVLLDTNASRRHAVIAREAQGFVLRDLWSLNGVEVNGRRVESAVLQHGDRIRIGDTVLEFLWPEQAGGAGEAASADSGERVLSRPSELQRKDIPPAAGDEQAVEDQGENDAGLDAGPPSRSQVATPEGAESFSHEPGGAPRAPVVPRPGRVAGRRRRRVVSPTTIVLSATVAILLLVVGVLASRNHARSVSSTRAAPEPPPSLDTLTRIAKARAELAAGEYRSALDTALLAQATAPEVRDTTRLVHQVAEAWATSWLEQRLRKHLEEASNPVTPEPTLTPVPETRPSPPSTSEGAGTAVAQPASVRGAPPTARVASVPVRKPAGSPQAQGASPRATGSVAEEPGAPRSALDRRVADLYRKGMEAREQGRYLEAVQAFEKAKSEDPYKESELYYTVQDELQRAIEQLHALARPLVAEAGKLEQAGRLTEARQKLADAVSKDPYYTPAVTRLRQLEQRLVARARKVLLDAQAREKEGDIAGAVEAYRKVLELVPDPSNVYHQTATRKLEELE